MKNPASARPRRVLRMPATEEKVGLKETQIRDKIAKGEFPKPIRLSASGRAVGFIEAELDDYIDRMIAERDRGYQTKPTELARIEASREGIQRAKAKREASRSKRAAVS